MLAIVVLTTSIAAADPGVETGRLVVVTGVAGASVALDGHPIGTTPLDESVAVGGHTISVEHAGFVTVSKAIEVEAGAVQRIALPLEPIPPRQRVGVTIGTAIAAC